MTKSADWYRDPRKVSRRIAAWLRDQWLILLLFVLVNVLIGSLGLWLSSLQHWVNDMDHRGPLVEQLNSGSFYTFAIAFLTSCTSLIVAEYLELKTAITGRHMKIFLFMVSSSLILLCALLATSIPKSTLTDKPPAASAASQAGGSPVKSGSGEAIVAGAQKELAQLPRWHMVQLWLTGAAVVVGLLLYLVVQYSATAMRRAIDNIEADEALDADDLASKASGLIG